MTISIEDSINKENKEKTFERNSAFKINSIILNRWSPRSMTGEELDNDTLMSLFEAARWAPSSFNNQPWRFIYAKRNTKYRDTIFDLLVESNKVWAKNAGILIVVISNKNFEYNGKFSITHQYDAGAAWENLALEATSRGLIAHGMQGFDYEKARIELGVPEDYSVEMMIAVGKLGKTEDLPEALQSREKPSGRKKLEDLVFEGKFIETSPFPPRA